MKILVCILLWLNAYSQDSPYVATWITKYDTLVNTYQVQQSQNRTNWLTLATVQSKKKDSNYYFYVLPKVPVFYRIAAVMKGNGVYYSDTILLDTNFAIHNVYVKTRQVYFTSDNEKNKIASYQILQSRKATSGFTLFQTLPSVGNSNYVTKRFSNQQKYFRITAVFKSGTKQILTTRLLAK